MKVFLFYISLYFLFQQSEILSQELKVFYSLDFDSTFFSGQKKFLFVNENNHIRFEGNGKIIHLTSSNGKVIFDSSLNCYTVKPIEVGEVILLAVINLNSSNRQDTIIVNQIFSSISHPILRVEVIKDKFREEGTIYLSVFDESDNYPISNRYVPCNYWAKVEVFDDSLNYIGYMIQLEKKFINLNSWVYYSDVEIKSGFFINPIFDIRDLKTGLIFSTIDCFYKLK